MEEHAAHCMKCKTKVPMKNPSVVTMKNGRKAAKGTCQKCGTTIMRFLPTKK